MNNTQNNYQNRLRVNHFIRVPQVRVVDGEGNSLGVMSTRDALKMAQDQNMDLIEINPKTMPPVCKIMNYGKFKYEEKKKLSESRKNQKVQELKELTFRPTIDSNDLNHKLQQAKDFLEDGNRVKFTVRFRGREIVHPEVGKEKLEWVLQELNGLIAPNTYISLEGKFMSMQVAPIKK